MRCSQRIALRLHNGAQRFGDVARFDQCEPLRRADLILALLRLGTASHAIGTAKAMELGEVEGAMSSLSIVVAGLITVIGATIFSHIM